MRLETVEPVMSEANQYKKQYSLRSQQLKTKHLVSSPQKQLQPMQSFSSLQGAVTTDSPKIPVVIRNICSTALPKEDIDTLMQNIDSNHNEEDSISSFRNASEPVRPPKA